MKNLFPSRRIKLNKKSKRRLIRENRAATKIFWCYRKYRVHMLLFCVVKFIRAKALYFKNQEIQEEIDYRMRTAMRRVREDKQFKVWKSEQSVKSTFPVKPPASEFAPIIAFTRKNYLVNNPAVTPVAVVSPATVISTSEAQFNADNEPPANTPAAITVDTSVGNTFLTEPNTSANSRVSSPRPPTSPRGKNTKDNKDAKDKAPTKSPRAQPASPMPVKKDIAKSASKADTTASAAGESKLFTTSVSPRNNNNATPTVTTATATTASHSLVPVAPTKPRPLTKEEKEFNYHRPDLAPFSTMINNMISNNALFKSQQKSEPSWVDIASVSADYGKVYNSTQNTTNSKLKSPAYAALEKFCGITQEDLERRKLAKNKDLVNLKLKSFGHSIVSL